MRQLALQESLWGEPPQAPVKSPMLSNSHPTVQPTQEFLAAQPALPWWKRVLNRLFAPEGRWHRSRSGYGYSATWTLVSSDGSVSQTNRKVAPEPEPVSGGEAGGRQ